MKLFVAATGALLAALWCSTLAYADSLSILPTTLPAAQVGADYTNADGTAVTFTAFPTTVSSYTWTTTQLPSWLTLTQDGSNQATISGTPTQAIASGFTVQVTDSAKDSPADVTYSLIVNKGSPQLTWTPSPASISFGTALSSAQLDASATDQSLNPLVGSFDYQPPLGAVLNAGTQTMTTLFTPTDTTKYSTATTQTTITVDPADTAVALSDVTATFGQSDVQLAATVTFTVSGTVRRVSGGTVTFTLCQGSTQVGNQLSAQVANGSANASVLISGVQPGAYTYVATYIPPSGSATVNCTTQTVNPPGTGVDFNGSSTTANLTINEATPPITWEPASPVRYHVPVTSAQLNASSSLQGTFAYTDASNAPVVGGTYAFSATGSQVLKATFTPTDSADYATRTVSRTIRVLPDATKVQITDGSGNSLSPTIWTAAFGDTSVTLGAKVSVTTADTGFTVPTQGSVTFTVSDSSGVVGSVSQPVDSSGLASASFSLSGINAGSYHVQAKFAATLFASSSAAGTLRITKAKPSVSWSTPVGIQYGTPLSTTQLDATSTLPGLFTYTPAVGTILPAGSSRALKVLFRPSDSKDYASATATVNIAVDPATVSLSMTSQSPAANATHVTLVARLTALTPVNGGTVNFTTSGFCGTERTTGLVSDSVAKAVLSLEQLSAGTCSVTATYSSTSQFAAASQTFSNALTVSKQVKPTITWSTPSAIAYGTALSTTELDATAADSLGNSIAGSFVYSPAAGTTLLVGQHVLKVTFKPTDSIDFTDAAGSVTLQVDQATTSISVLSKSPAHGATSVTLSALVSSPSAIVNGGVVRFTVTDSGGPVRLSSATVSKGAANVSISLTGLLAGTYTISGTYEGSTRFLASNAGTNSLIIS